MSALDAFAKKATGVFGALGSSSWTLQSAPFVAGSGDASGPGTSGQGADASTDEDEDFVRPSLWERHFAAASGPGSGSGSEEASGEDDEDSRAATAPHPTVAEGPVSARARHQFDLESDEDDNDRIAMGAGRGADEGPAEGGDEGEEGDEAALKRGRAGLEAAYERERNAIRRKAAVAANRRAERDAMLARRSAATADSDVDEKDDDAGPSPRAPVGNAGGPSGASASHRAAEQPRPRRAPGLLRPALKAAGAVRQGTASGAHGEGGADAGAQPRQSKRVRFVDTGEEKPSPKRRMVEGGPARSLPPRSNPGRRRSIMPDFMRNPDSYTCYDMEGGVSVGAGIPSWDSGNGAGQGGRTGVRTAGGLAGSDEAWVGARSEAGVAESLGSDYEEAGAAREGGGDAEGGASTGGGDGGAAPGIGGMARLLFQPRQRRNADPDRPVRRAAGIAKESQVGGLSFDGEEEGDD